MIKYFLLFFVALFGCVTPPPKQPENLCGIFKEYNNWYYSAKNSQKMWGTPVHVTMAMMYQESSFRAQALPPKNHILGVIPWGRVSTAYGYAQAKTATWSDYIKESSNSGADRDDFEDAIDFMGWFTSKTNKVNKISKWDAYNQYLNYHEGWTGFKRKSYKKKPWLITVSKKVTRRSHRYAEQMRRCKI